MIALWSLSTDISLYIRKAIVFCAKELLILLLHLTLDLCTTTFHFLRHWRVSANQSRQYWTWWANEYKAASNIRYSWKAFLNDLDLLESLKYFTLKACLWRKQPDSWISLHLGEGLFLPYRSGVQIVLYRKHVCTVVQDFWNCGLGPTNWLQPDFWRVAKLTSW